MRRKVTRVGPTDSPSDVEALKNRADNALSASNEASSQVLALFVAYLSLMVYCAVVVLRTHHEQILRLSPIKLPFVDLELPLREFYLLAPLFVVVFHLHLLFNCRILADKVHLLEGYLEHMSGHARDDYYCRLHNLHFTQWIAQKRQDPIVRWLLRLLVALSLVGFPLSLLLVFQSEFLPYHSEAVTGWHQLLVVFDTALVVLFWPSIASPDPAGWWRALWPWPARQDSAGDNAKRRTSEGALPLFLFVVAAVPLSLVFANVPGSVVERALLAHAPEALMISCSDDWDWRRPPRRMFSLTCALFERRNSYFGWSRNLVVRDAILVGNKELSPQIAHRIRQALETGTALPRDILNQITPLDLQGRDLRYAVLERSALPRVDLRPLGALESEPTTQLANERSRASSAMQKLVDDVPPPGFGRKANLEGAVFRQAFMQDAKLSQAWARHAIFERAILLNATLDSADFVGSHFEGALLDQAHIDRTDFSGCDMSSSSMTWREASTKRFDPRNELFGGANFNGANLHNVRFTGRHLSNSSFVAAVLANAVFDGSATLINADFSLAQLGGADLRNARLSGAAFVGAYLLGTRLGGAVFEEQYASIEPFTVRSTYEWGFAAKPDTKPRGLFDLITVGRLNFDTRLSPQRPTSPVDPKKWLDALPKRYCTTLGPRSASIAGCDTDPETHASELESMIMDLVCRDSHDEIARAHVANMVIRRAIVEQDPAMNATPGPRQKMYRRILKAIVLGEHCKLPDDEVNPSLLEEGKRQLIKARDRLQ